MGGWMRAASVAGLLALAAGAAAAEGLKINPGLWRATYNNPMTGEQVVEECMKESEIDPLAMMQENGGCDVIEQSVADNTMDVVMSCGDPPTEAHMVASVEEGGERGNAEMTMTMDLGGKTQEFRMTWVSERIGDC